MYIKQIEIDNFRNFPSAKKEKGGVFVSKIEFTEGTNIIIGHNNAGKTNLIKALQLVFDSRRSRGRLTIDDFSKEYSDFSKPPEMNITVTFEESLDEPLDDQVLLFDWIIKPDFKYEAKLTFSFFLPQGDDYNEYCTEVVKFKKGDKYDSDQVWRFIKKYYFSKYVYRVYGGNPKKKETADADMLDKFDFQFLDAIRDAEKQMFFGNNTILKEVLNYFLDYDITEGKKIRDLSTKAKRELRDKEREFEEKSTSIFSQLKERISKENILKYSNETGANRGGKPDFDVHVSEDDLLFALRLIVKVGDMSIPISNNGLGYNNLLYTALVLAKMQIESESSYYGENAKIFPILAIEEPEAHLHPAMQYKFLRFLKENSGKAGKVRQLFLTTHSTHITSAAELDNIICLYKDSVGKSSVGYPGKAFGENEDSKNYVKRFLDATKSNMLFADKVFFVEGLAEQLLLPSLAAYKFYNKAENITFEDELINQHVSIVSVDSRTFKHFLRLYSFSDDNPHAIKKKVVCLTDSDPEQKGGDGKWRGCFPYQLKKDSNHKPLASHLTELKNDFDDKFDNIYVFHPEESKGKTLEHELIRYNPKSSLIFTECFPEQGSPHTIINFRSLQAIFISDPTDFKKLLTHYQSLLITEKQKEAFESLEEQITDSILPIEEKSTAVLARIYYNIVKGFKGEHALFLEKNLRDNLSSGVPQFIKVPTYIEEAVIEILN